jgi:hypothetical protein
MRSFRLFLVSGLADLGEFRKRSSDEVLGQIRAQRGGDHFCRGAGVSAQDDEDALLPRGCPQQPAEHQSGVKAARPGGSRRSTGFLASKLCSDRQCCSAYLCGGPRAGLDRWTNWLEAKLRDMSSRGSSSALGDEAVLGAGRMVA